MSRSVGPNIVQIAYSVILSLVKCVKEICISGGEALQLSIQ